MHPALSIIVFTTSSGAGYGLLFLLGILVPLGAAPADRWFGGIAIGLAFALIGGGLLSSAAHLGRPERAWRGFSQWRSSWLSREAVLSVATFIPAGLFGLGWVVLGRLDSAVAAAGVIAALGAVVTVIATAMIYASLKPIPQWASPYTVPGYLVYALMTGTVLLNALLHLFGQANILIGLLSAVTIGVGWLWKILTWQHDDAADLPASAQDALGLAGGPIRSVEWPHTEKNYLLKEMGYRIARKHAARLRRIVQLCAFAAPLALILLALATGELLAAGLAVAAVLVQAPGMLVERWLFFAEAKHVVSLYYQPDATQQTI